MSTTEKQSLYVRVTNQIVTAIENGVGTWKMPWYASNGLSSPSINVSSRKPYRGINTLCLWAAAQEKSYCSNEWGTYHQWADRGAQVRKGEKATLVVFWKFADKVTESQDDAGDDHTTSPSRLLFVRGYSVFNAAQVDGYSPALEAEKPMADRIASADSFFKGIGAEIRHGGNRAYYSASTDYIQMPDFAKFVENTAYYATLAHEHAHWTGKADRCNRQLGKRFADDAYAAEELVAELASAFVCAHLGFGTEPRPDHAEYIQDWLRVLKADQHAIFTVASKAQQAADYLVERAEGVSRAAA